MKTISVSRLREVLNYDTETGVFTYLLVTSNRIKLGSVAGTKTPQGYIRIKIDNDLLYAHRLAILYVEGEEPPHEVDHINGVKEDNRYANLRHSTHAENQQNLADKARNTSGYRGVDFHTPSQRWRARITHNGETQHIGMFCTSEEASSYYKIAKEQTHTFNPILR